MDLNTQVVLVTGSSGLVGRALAPRLERAGARVSPLDLRGLPGAGYGDIRDPKAVRGATAEATGVVHLAADSRVVTGQADPPACWAVSIDAAHDILLAAAEAPRKPRVIYASSREVYGQQSQVPVKENADNRAINVYARSWSASTPLSNGVEGLVGAFAALAARVVEAAPQPVMTGVRS